MKFGLMTTIALIILQCCGVIHCPWWLVLLPTLLPLTISVALVGAVLLWIVACSVEYGTGVLDQLKT